MLRAGQIGKNLVLLKVRMKLSKGLCCVHMTAEADSIKFLIKVENTDRDGAGFTNRKTRIVNKQHYKSNNYAYILTNEGVIKNLTKNIQFAQLLNLFLLNATLTGRRIINADVSKQTPRDLN